MDDQYLVGGAPVLIAGSPEWEAAGVGETVTNAGGTWIRYMFTWTGSLTPNASTAILEASVPFTEPLQNPPETSRWIIIATADGVKPATGEGTSATFIKQTSAVIRCGGVIAAARAVGVLPDLV